MGAKQKKSQELSRVLLKEITSKSLQNDNVPSFVSKVMSRLPPLENLLPPLCLLEAQSSGKAEWANHYLKRTVAKICQEISQSWFKHLPDEYGLKATLQLSRFEISMAEPFSPPKASLIQIPKII